MDTATSKKECNNNNYSFNYIIIINLEDFLSYTTHCEIKKRVTFSSLFNSLSFSRFQVIRDR